MNKVKFSRGIKKYIRKEKARIRKMSVSKEEKNKLIENLLNNLSGQSEVSVK